MPGQCRPLAVYLVEPTNFSHGRSLLSEFAANDSFEDSAHVTLQICVKDNIGLRTICDTFSRLGTLDKDAAKFVA